METEEGKTEMLILGQIGDNDELQRHSTLKEIYETQDYLICWIYVLKNHEANTKRSIRRKARMDLQTKCECSVTINIKVCHYITVWY